MSNEPDEVSRTRTAWLGTAVAAAAVAALLFVTAAVDGRTLLYVPGVLVLAAAVLAVGQTHLRRNPIPPAMPTASSSRRPGVPAPPWTLLALGLLVTLAAAFTAVAVVLGR